MGLKERYICKTDLTVQKADDILGSFFGAKKGTIKPFVNNFGAFVHINQVVDSRISINGGTNIRDNQKLSKALTLIDSGFDHKALRSELGLLNHSSGLNELELEQEKCNVWRELIRMRGKLSVFDLDLLAVKGTGYLLLTEKISEKLDQVKVESWRPIPIWLTEWNTEDEIKNILIKAFEKAGNLNISRKRGMFLTQELDTQSFLLLSEVVRAKVFGYELEDKDLYELLVETSIGNYDISRYLIDKEKRLVKFFNRNNIPLRFCRSGIYSTTSITVKETRLN